MYGSIGAFLENMERKLPLRRREMRKWNAEVITTRPETMPRNSEDSPVDRRRRRRRDSASPEPYRERRTSGERRGTESPRSTSRSREPKRQRRRYSHSHERPGRSRSRSPRRRPERRYDDDERHRSSRRKDDYDDGHSKRRHRSSAQSPRRLKHKDAAPIKHSEALPSQQDAFQNEPATMVEETPLAEKQKANYSTTGRLAAESNTVKSSGGLAIVLKYHEPPEARKPPPSRAWRMYVFKGSEIMDTIELSQRSCWLFGREAAVVDFLVEHPSCSKQHAVVQFRYMEKRNEFGDKTGKVRPYLIDLESANGTSVNGQEVPAGRYLELQDKDVLKFGHSTREYVMQLPP